MHNNPHFTFTDHVSGCQIRNITLKTFTGDILRQKTDGIVNSVTDEFKFIGIYNMCLVMRKPYFFMLYKHQPGQHIMLYKHQPGQHIMLYKHQPGQHIMLYKHQPGQHISYHF